MPRKQAPTLIAIDHDDYHAEYVGQTSDGRQFLLTTPFVPAMGANPGREFIALFDNKRGKLFEAGSPTWGHVRNWITTRAERSGTSAFVVSETLLMGESRWRHFRSSDSGLCLV